VDLPQSLIKGSVLRGGLEGGRGGREAGRMGEYSFWSFFSFISSRACSGGAGGREGKKEGRRERGKTYLGEAEERSILGGVDVFLLVGIDVWHEKMPVLSSLPPFFFSPSLPPSLPGSEPHTPPPVVGTRSGCSSSCVGENQESEYTSLSLPPSSLPPSFLPSLSFWV